ncbi:MAG: D-aminoacyl-tRNA deacylase [Candidatus Geothermincolia bacterium]
MRAVVQRVEWCRVYEGDDLFSSIGRGLAALIGVERGDTAADALYLARKLPALRIFSDSDGKLNLSLDDAAGELMLISQFTLLADARAGRRPSYIRAMAPAEAETLFYALAGAFEEAGRAVSLGAYGRHMRVELANDGPVTILLDSRRIF